LVFPGRRGGAWSERHASTPWGGAAWHALSGPKRSNPTDISPEAFKSGFGLVPTPLA